MGERILVLVRHGQSEWNLKNLFTGWRDVGLTENGVGEARTAGRKLKAQNIRFDVAFTSALVRAQHSLDLMLEEIGQTSIPVFKDQALNERDYGDLVGLNKDDARAKWGAEQVQPGGVRTISRRPAARVSRTPPRACCLITSRRCCRACCAATTCSSPPTAIRCARW